MCRAQNAAKSIVTCAILVASTPLAPVLLSAESEPEQPSADPTACQLNIAGKFIEELVLVDEAGHTKQLNQPGPSVTLPAGQYRVSQVELKGGFLCTVVGTEESDSFRLTPDEPHELQVGAPLNPNAKVTRQGRLLELDYQLLDASGHNYTNQDRENPPRFTVHKNGQEIGSGSFEYG